MNVPFDHAGPTRIPLPAGDIPGNLRQVVEAIRDAIANHEKRLAQKEIVSNSLDELFRRSGASSTDNFIEASEVVPPVKNFVARVLPDRITFLLPLGPFVVTAATPTPTRAVTRLWRGLEDDAAQTLDFVAETQLQQLVDIPPSDVAYRYFLQYRSFDGSKVGPMSPPEGILFKATSASPESVLSSKDGGLFLETFEDANVALNWDEYEGSTATIDYPENGVVGGKVARIAGDMWWGIAKQIIPFDPNVIYRVRAGVKRTVAASGGAAGQDAIYIGVAGVAADGVTLINTSGGNSHTSQHYVAALGEIPTLNAYAEYTGYFKGTSSSGAGAFSPHLDAPGLLYTGSKYFRPIVIVNYNEGNGTTEIDYIRIDVLQPTPPWITRGQCFAQDSTVQKVGGSSAWDSDFSSLNSFTTCFIRAKASQTNADIMIALNSDPLTDASYTSLDRAWQWASDGNCYIYEGSSSQGNFGPYTTSTELAIVRDLAAQTITYYKDRVAVLTRTGISAASRYYADGSFYTPGGAINSVDFGPGNVVPLLDTAQIGDGAVHTFGLVTGNSSGTTRSDREMVSRLDFTPQFDCTVVVDAVLDGYSQFDADSGSQIFCVLLETADIDTSLGIDRYPTSGVQFGYGGIQAGIRTGYSRVGVFAVTGGVQYTAAIAGTYSVGASGWKAWQTQLSVMEAKR